MENGNSYLACHLPFNNISIYALWQIFNANRHSTTSNTNNDNYFSSNNGICFNALCNEITWQLDKDVIQFIHL